MFQFDKIKVTSLKHHRNGVGGISFYAFRFSFVDDYGKTRNAIASVFDNGNSNHQFSGYCSVLVENAGGTIDIHDCYRGDYFEQNLRNFIDSVDGQKMRGMLTDAELKAKYAPA